MENLVTINLSANARSDNAFELGGRHSNVVTFSENHKIGKGWRLLKIDGVDVGTGDKVSAALTAARRRGKYSATFHGGKTHMPSRGVNLKALGTAVVATSKLMESQKAAPAPAPAPVPTPAPAPSVAVASPIPAPEPEPAPSSSCGLMLPAEAERLKHEFISFDADRDGLHDLHDFIAMLLKLNEEYDFMASEGPAMAAFARKQWASAGGRRPDPDDDDDEGAYVTLDGFCNWYRPFIEQCEQRKRDEYTVTKDLSGAQFEAHMARLTLTERNRRYPLLHAPG